MPSHAIVPQVLPYLAAKAKIAVKKGRKRIGDNRRLSRDNCERKRKISDHNIIK